MKDLDKMTNDEKAIYLEIRGDSQNHEGNVLCEQNGQLLALKAEILKAVDKLIEGLITDNKATADRCKDRADHDYKAAKKIGKEEEKEELSITPTERDFLKTINLVSADKIGFAARDSNGDAYFYLEEPAKSGETWGNATSLLCISDKYFPFIKWEDEEPWSFEDLLALPVKE